jgi:2-polyprenyl-6-methoxyphenol hydroxylase-like FAD-dependent oxidoreductase
MAGYPILRAGERGEKPARDYNFIWYRPANSEVLNDLLTDANGQRHEMNIPPPLVDTRHKKKAQQDAAALLAPQFSEAVSLADSLFCQPIYDVEVPRMACGRIALLGDAAFVARPHVGAGVTKGFSDAFALRQALDQYSSVQIGLKAFERVRLPIGRRILERARHLGAYMQADKNTPAERIAAEQHRQPEAILRETASLDFLKS